MKVGDELKIRFGQKIVTYQIDEIKDTTKKDEAASMFTILKEETAE